VTSAELQRADEYEGPEYVRAIVALQSGKPAWIYVRP
jgi:hypothetical protein